ncbi:hypothetical protein CWI36_0321p0020 [Hamiltosporidium magnivora]|uniref:Uncharacterized protein n=1 Tax=Hamiltosporidium magnivora TaxID=148818 RepID=A0A4Q9LGD1_9MICR|nr:hypothetical protein CWI36_0321p0020 [Hamiltosporidium magnivora]
MYTRIRTDELIKSKIKKIKNQQCGIIESDFELSYFLKLSKDILEISDNLNNFKFKCMLTVLKCLKAVKHKNNVKLLQAFIYTDLVFKDLSNSKNNYIDYYIKKDFISAFLNIFMIQFEFHNENLILSFFKFLLELNSSIDKNIEFLSLKNLLVPKDTLALLLKKKEELDGLVLHDVKTVENLSFIDECLNLNGKIDYVDFENVDISENRWKLFFDEFKVSKLILKLGYGSRNFIDEFIKLKSNIYISYLSLNLNYYSMTEEFCRSLMLFEELETQKLYDYKVKEYTESFFIYTIERMKYLEDLIIPRSSYEVTDDFKFYLQNWEIRTFHLENI